MQKIIILVLLSFLTLGCVRKITIEQGNIVTPEMSKSIHMGMSKDDVKRIMGTPMLLNTFADNRVSYVYTIQPGGKNMTLKYMTLVFKNDKVKAIYKSANLDTPLPKAEKDKKKK